jgi:hypothetical protein
MRGSTSPSQLCVIVSARPQYDIDISNVLDIASVALELLVGNLEETAALKTKRSEERFQCHGVELAVICSSLASVCNTKKNTPRAKGALLLILSLVPKHSF